MRRRNYSERKNWTVCENLPRFWWVHAKCMHACESDGCMFCVMHARKHGRGHGGPLILSIMPAECPEGEVFSECKKCEETCAEPNPICPLTAACIPGCECAKGTIRNEKTGKCVETCSPSGPQFPRELHFQDCMQRSLRARDLCLFAHIQLSVPKERFLRSANIVPL